MNDATKSCLSTAFLIFIAAAWIGAGEGRSQATSGDSDEATKLTTLKVVGTRIVDSTNQPVRLRGVNMASLEWSSDGDGHILKTVEVAIRDWHANIIRLPLSQDRWFGKAPGQNDGGKSYRALVQQVVEKCTSRQCYIILDLHWSDCNEWGKNIGQHSMPHLNSVAFWKDVAPRYANNPGVLFDLYNEPHDVSWDVWLNGGRITDTPKASLTSWWSKTLPNSGAFS